MPVYGLDETSEARASREHRELMMEVIWESLAHDYHEIGRAISGLEQHAFDSLLKRLSATEFIGRVIERQKKKLVEAAKLAKRFDDNGAPRRTKPPAKKTKAKSKARTSAKKPAPRVPSFAKKANKANTASVASIKAGNKKAELELVDKEILDIHGKFRIGEAIVRISTARGIVVSKCRGIAAAAIKRLQKGGLLKVEGSGKNLLYEVKQKDLFEKANGATAHA